ncbi:MAG: hypothetical protein Ta2D_05420 [Rickettsiales bacterium]|nr:MAG: hypothetical protein Ta2D_05420 [Rickettsiales bacterium]
MTKYLYGKAHQGNPLIANASYNGTLAETSIGKAVYLDANGKVNLFTGTGEVAGILVAFNGDTKKADYLKQGEKVGVAGAGDIGSAVYVKADGTFTSTSTGATLVKGLFVGQDSSTAEETLPTGLALIDFI